MLVWHPSDCGSNSGESVASHPGIGKERRELRVERQSVRKSMLRDFVAWLDDGGEKQL